MYKCRVNLTSQTAFFIVGNIKNLSTADIDGFLAFTEFERNSFTVLSKLLLLTAA